MTRGAAVVLALVCLGLGACAGGPATDAGSPSASIGPGIEAYAGRWRGTLWETAGSLYQGTSNVEVVLAEDGTWKGRVGSAPASGTARLEGNRLVVEGMAGAPDGPQRPVYAELTGDEERRWGELAALFAGRRAPATLQLERQAP